MFGLDEYIRRLNTKQCGLFLNLECGYKALPATNINSDTIQYKCLLHRQDIICMWAGV